LKNVQFCAKSRKTIILTTGIHGVFRGLKFESDAELVQKGAFFKGLLLKQAFFYVIQLKENGMKRLKKHRSLWLCCTLLFLPFMIAGPSNAQCTKTTAQIEAVVATCGKGDLNCFVSLATKNVDCAAKIAWYYVIINKPDNLDGVLNSFLVGIEKEYPNLAPIPNAYAEHLNASITAAYRAIQHEQKTGSTAGLCNTDSGQIEGAVASCAGDLDCIVSLAESNMDCADKIVWYYMIQNKPDNPSAVKKKILSSLPSAYADDLTASINAANQANKDEEDATETFENEYPYGQ